MSGKRRRIAAIAGGIALILAAVTLLLLFKGGADNMERGLDQEKENGIVAEEITSEGQSRDGDETGSGAAVQPTIVSDGGYGEGEAVKVNQVGYPVGAAKIGIIAGEEWDTGDAAFQLIKADSGEPVYSGTVTAPVFDAASGEKVSRADFSDFNEPGVYQLAVEGAGRSFPFEIGEGLYGKELTMLLRSYTLQRVGVDIEDNISGVKVPAGHSQDRQSVISFSDGISRQGDIIDASGGWYDAGDFGKYISPAAVSVAQLLLAFELNPGAFPEGQMSFPPGLESAQQGLPDVLAEVRIELDWMLKMQREDGAVFHKMSGAAWPGFIMPQDDTQTRYIYGLSTFSTAQFVGATALAARIYEPYDQEFAAILLDAAERSQRYLDANPSFSFRQDEGQDNGSGGYGKNSDREERLWAAAELFRTTGSAAYGEQAETYEDLLGKNAQPVTWMDSGILGQWAYYHAEGADSVRKGAIVDAFARSADSIVQRSAADGYLTALRLQDYHWASAKLAAAYGSLLLLANELKPSPAYEQVALEQLHYVFGRTATGYSYVTAIGTKYPENPHHRTSDASGVLFPGLVVGGPNRDGGDPDLDAVKDKLSPAKAYLDVLGSYSSNEYAIDYNAPVVFLAAYFADPDQ
ncbi:glycoside hydrolase family 9 protein [Paenibacillus sp. CAU 1782]